MACILKSIDYVLIQIGSIVGDTPLVRLLPFQQPDNTHGIYLIERRPFRGELFAQFKIGPLTAPGRNFEADLCRKTSRIMSCD